MQFIPIVERHAQTQSVTDFSVPSEGYGQFLVDVFHEWYGARCRKNLCVAV